MGIVIPPTSPWTFYKATDYQGKVLSGTVTFDGSNNLTGGTVHRDAGCQYNKILLGDPANPTQTFDLSGFSGDRTFTQAQLNSVGLFTVADIENAPQITASP